MKRQLIETNTQMAEMLELSYKNFKAILIKRTALMINYKKLLKQMKMAS